MINRFVNQSDLLLVHFQVTVDLFAQAVGIDNNGFSEPSRSLVVQSAIGPDSWADRARRRKCVHGLHVDDQRPRGVQYGSDVRVQHVDMTERESNRREEVLARRPQQPMFIRPGKRDAADSLSIVAVESSGRGTEHQVEFFARVKATSHLGHHSRPEPMSPRGMAGVLGEQVDGHTETCIAGSGLRRPGRSGQCGESSS